MNRVTLFNATGDVLEARGTNGEGSARNSVETVRADRLRLMRRAGFQYSGRRDIYSVAGYPTSLTFADYLDRYERGDVAGRVVDMPPKATWKRPPRVTDMGVEAGEDTAFTKAVGDLAKRLGMWGRLSRVDRLARIGEYGVLVIGQRADDAALDKPLGNMSVPGDVIYLKAYHQGAAAIQGFVGETSDPRFGLPKSYRIRLGAETRGFGQQIDVHASRVIHVAEDTLADDVYGRPALRRITNRLIDLEKVTASTAEAYWQLADKILTGEIDPTSRIGDAELGELKEALEEIVHDLRRQFIGQGVKLGYIGGDTPDPKNAADLYMMLIAADAGIPKRILFGTETGERASDQDERQWLGSVGERQVQHAEPAILRPLLDRLIEHGALPEPRGGEYVVDWPNLFELDESSAATVNKTAAETAAALTPVGGDPYELVEVDDAGRVRLKPSSAVLEDRETAPPPPAAPDPEDDLEP